MSEKPKEIYYGSGPQMHRTNKKCFSYDPFREDRRMEHDGFLFYDSLVRGAGVGHNLCSYNYGLIQAMDNNMIFLPEQFICGHNLGRDGLFEFAMGLPDCSTARKIVERRMPSRIAQIEFDEGVSRGCLSNDFSQTKKYFNDCYENRKLVFKSSMVPDKINICINIRRGDIVLQDNYGENIKRRILPDSYYTRATDYIIKRLNLKPKDFHIHLFSDGDRNPSGESHYINEKGEKIAPLKLFKKWRDQTSFLIGEDSDSIYRTIQACSECDVFIASNSGFSGAISLYLREDSISVIPSEYFFTPFKSTNYIKLKVDQKEHDKYHLKTQLKENEHTL